MVEAHSVVCWFFSQNRGSWLMWEATKSCCLKFLLAWQCCVVMYLYSRSCCTLLHTNENYYIVSNSMFPISHTVSQMLSCFIYIEPHPTGFCPESTDQTPLDLLPAVVAFSAILFAVILLLAVVILAIILLYTSESNV